MTMVFLLTLVATSLPHNAREMMAMLPHVMWQPASANHHHVIATERAALQPRAGCPVVHVVSFLDFIA